MEAVTWSAAVVSALRAAGWFEGRRVDTSAWRHQLAAEGFVMHPMAHAFLSEFGGLAVDVSGPGREFARTSFDFDPALCAGQKEWFDSLTSGTAGKLFPVGEEGGGHASFAIDVAGVVHMLFNSTIIAVGPGRLAPARLIEGEHG